MSYFLIGAITVRDVEGYEPYMTGAFASLQSAGGEALAYGSATAIEGDVRRATALHLKLLSLHKQLFCEPSPAPTKWALSQLGRCSPAVRLPITPLTDAGQSLVGAAMREAGLL